MSSQIISEQVQTLTFCVLLVLECSDCYNCSRKNARNPSAVSFFAFIVCSQILGIKTPRFAGYDEFNTIYLTNYLCF